MFLIEIINVLQALGLYLLWGKVSALAWWSLLTLFAVLFFGVRTHYAVKPEDGPQVAIFWYEARSIIFIVDIISILLLYGYVFFS